MSGSGLSKFLCRSCSSPNLDIYDVPDYDAMVLGMGRNVAKIQTELKFDFKASAPETNSSQGPFFDEILKWLLEVLSDIPDSKKNDISGVGYLQDTAFVKFSDPSLIPVVEGALKQRNDIGFDNRNFPGKVCTMPHVRCVTLHKLSQNYTVEDIKKKISKYMSLFYVKEYINDNRVELLGIPHAPITTSYITIKGHQAYIVVE